MLFDRKDFQRIATVLFLVSFWIALNALGSRSAFAGTALGDLAASMKPGEWRQLVTNNFQNGNILLDGGAAGYALQYTDRILWDSTRKRLYFIGQAHQGPGTGGKFLRYDESNNTWTILDSGPMYWIPINNGPSHSYNEYTINAALGKIYLRKYYTGEVHTYDIVSDTWFKELPNMSGNFSVGNALCYFPERNGLYHFDGDWGIRFYSYATNSWSFIASTGASGAYPTGAYHVFCQYNPIRKEILFGGGSAYGNSNKIHRVLFDGSIQNLSASVPPGVEFNRNQGLGHLAVVDPVTGDYLFITTDSVGNGTFRSYNSATDTWAVLGNPPPWFGNSVDGDHFGTVATAIPDYGVLLFVDYESGGAYGGAPKIWLYKHSSSSNDMIAPSIVAGLTATTVSSFQINLTWLASTDNVGVAGYTIFRNGTQIATVSGTSFQDSGLSPATTYLYAVRAYDAAGNFSALSNSVTATTQSTSTGSVDFQARCSQPGVVLCAPLDSSTELGPRVGDLGYPTNTFVNGFGSGCASVTGNNSCPVIDTSVKASGAGSLRFTMHSNSGSGNSGQWYINFPKIGEGETLYLQWRQRFSPEYLSNKYYSFFSAPTADITPSATSGTAVTITASAPIFDASWQSLGIVLYDLNSAWSAIVRQFVNPTTVVVNTVQPFSNTNTIQSGTWAAGGIVQPKILILTAGDDTGCGPTNPSACQGATGLTTIVPFIYGIFPTLSIYNNSGFNTAHTVAFAPMETPFGQGDLSRQNQRPSPYCLYSQAAFLPYTLMPPNGNCFPLVANEWMTFQIAITMGPRVNNEFTNSRVRVWAARENQPSELLHDVTNTFLATDPNRPNYGKLWLLTHSTNKYPGQGHPEAYTWYDEIIVSRNHIPDPASSGASAPSQPPAAPTTLLVR